MKTILLTGFCILTLSLSAQWNSLKGPYGGAIYNYANEEGSCYVTTSNGFYRSDDNGENWIRLDSNLPEFMEALGFCVDKDEVFLNYHDFKTKEYGFVYSNDKGEHWSQLPTPEPNWGVFEITYKNGLLIAFDNSGMIESYDKGQSWSSSSLNGRVSYAWQVASNHSYFFVSDISGSAYRRSVMDTTWQKIFDTPDNFYTFHISDSVLIIIMDRKPGFRSLDNGQTWDKMNLSGYNSDQLIAELGDTIYYSDIDNIFRSTDRGLKWNIIRAFPFPGLYFSDVLRVGNNLMASHFYAGLLKTTDEFQTYEPSSKGIYAQSCQRMITTDSFLFVLGEVSLGKYNFASGQWTDKSYVFDDYVGDLYYYQGVLYVISQYSNKIYISKDQGNTFDSKTVDIIFSGHSRNGKIFGFQNKVLIYGEGGIVVSEDSGETWIELEIRDWSTGTGDRINYLDIAVYRDQVIVISRENSGINKLYSTNDLVDWKGIPIAFQNGNFTASSVELITTPLNLFAVSYFNGKCRLYKLDTINSNFELCEGIQDICSHPFERRTIIITNHDKMIALSQDGYFYSEDSGLHWDRVIDEFSSQSSSRLTDMVVKDDILYASSYYLGVLHTAWDNIKSGEVKGFVFHDQNQNRIYDANDRPLADAFVQLKKSQHYLPTDQDGNYSFVYATALRDTLIPNYFSKYGSFFPDRLGFSPGDTALNFAYSIPTHIEDLSVDMVAISRARPGFTYFLDIDIKNQGALSCSGKLVLQFAPGFNYKNATVIPQFVSSGSLIWEFQNLASIEEIQIRVEFLIADTMTLNAPFEIKANLQDLSCNDIDLSDNSESIHDIIRGSYDPNEISVDKEIISKKDLDNKIALTYTVHFQNTGNHEAEFVKLNNFLSNFDLSTFKVIAASHPFSYNINDNNLLEVIFDMIHLPDSLSNASESQGYFKYSISPIPKYVHNNKILNHAVIYFDYNKPIITNEVTTKVVDIVRNKDLKFKENQAMIVVPNPNNGAFKIFGDDLNKERYDILRVYNLQGSCVFQRKDKIINEYSLDLNELPAGVYFLKIGNSNTVIGKIIIQN